MESVDEESQELMLWFLKLEFPIKKLRDGRRFKRGIVVNSAYIRSNNIHFFLKPHEELIALYATLGNVLDNVFAFSHLEINTVLFKYLKLN
jgi:hypothetical protein